MVTARARASRKLGLNPAPRDSRRPTTVAELVERLGAGRFDVVGDELTNTSLEGLRIVGRRWGEAVQLGEADGKTG